MTDSKYDHIFEAIVKKNLEAFAAGSVDGAAELYDDYAVVVDNGNHKSYYGMEQIKEMCAEYIKMGKVEVSMPRKKIYDVGNDRFLADSDFECRIVESGVVMRGYTQQLYHKKGDDWKCVYEAFTML
uniref:DUF4440 domain-containing protein n=1 Tax=Pristionchus pacificus TaxID=54126 RepID=A0A8R1ZCK6_PRIPA